MKKHIANTIISAAAVFALSACSLKEHPYGVFSNETFFLTEADAENALMYAYVPLNYIEYCQRFTFYIADGMTDEFCDYNMGNESVMSWDVSQTTEEMLYLFKSAYISLSRANTLIQEVGRMSIPQDRKDRYIGEAYFLRGFNHFMLAVNWGSVPIRKSPIVGVQDTFVQPDAIPDVWAQIIADLEKAESLLQVNKIQGRADRIAAQALLSRVYLYLASYKATGSPGYDWVKDADDMYAKSVEYAGKVIDGQSTYSLCDNIDDIYDVTRQNTCPEHIFITGMNREASGMEGTYSQLPCLWAIQISDYIYIPTTLIPETDPETGKVKVMKVIDYDTTWQTFRVDYRWKADHFTDNDLRGRLMVEQIYTPDGDEYLSFSPENQSSSDPTLCKYFFPFCRKYTDPYSVKSHTSANMYLIRMGEIYLNYAEAAGPTEKGYACVNAVRSRAGLPAVEPGLSVEDFRDVVREERVKELCFEGQYLYDLRRLHRVNSEYIKYRNIMEPYAYFFPFPQRESDLNPVK